MTNKTPRIKTVEVLQIAAGLAAALRWAIAFMPLDGVRFGLSDSPAFEMASFVLSLAFAAVEVGSTAYMMRAWRKETDASTRRTLAALWVSSLALTVFAQVPPLLANINREGVSEYPFWFQALWVTASVAVTFVTIGGLGYAEKTLAAPLAALPDASPTFTGTQPVKIVPQPTIETTNVAERTETPLEDTGGQNTMNHTQPTNDAILTHSEAILSIEELLATVPVTGDTARDVLSCYAVAPNASQDAVASHIGKSRARVGQVLAELSAARKIERNGQVKVLAE